MAEQQKTFPTYAIILLALIFLAGGMYALNEISLYTPDSTRYLVWAQSLASGAGYRDATAPDPARYVVHAPLYSLLLAPVAFWFPGSILAAKIATLALGALALMLIFRLFARSAGERLALLGCLILALNPLYFLYSTEVLSDIPFAAVLALAWLLIDRILAEEKFRVGLAVSAALTVAAALFLREIGVSVVLSSVAYLSLRQRYREALIVLLIPAVLYAGWYIRNELIVAPIENPPLTNARIFTYHFLTSPDASLFQEFAARIANNFGIYVRQLGDLVYAPFYFSMQYDVISPANPVMAWMTGLLSIFRYPIGVFTLLSILFGLRTDLKGPPGAAHRLLFLGLYVAVMLTYPINDIRFLLPMLILAIYYILIGWSTLGTGGRGAGSRALRKAVVALALLCLVPNLAWDALYARNSAASMQEVPPAEDAARLDPAAPTHFTKAFRSAGSWIAAHTDSGAVIMTQWKDLVLWVAGRKVLNVDQTLSLDEFESNLRDYHVGVLVSQVKKSGITEFAIQMHQSRRYAFEFLEKAGNTEIYRVSGRPAGSAVPPDRSPFDQSLSSLEHGRYAAAASVLAGLWSENRQNVTALYMLAVAKACAIDLAASDSLFRLLHSYPQAGIYLPKASMQQQLVAALAALEETSPGGPRADRIAAIAAGYWNAGIRSRARELVGEALKEDSASVGAMVFGFHFDLEENDIAGAQDLSLRLEQIAPTHPLVVAFKSILGLRRSIETESNRTLRAAYLDSLARTSYAIGLQEDAIDEILRARADGLHDPGLSILLADIYIGKRRPTPAREILLSILASDPESAEARIRLENPFLQP